VIKHKIYDRNRELVTCPFERFTIENDKEEDMKKALIPTGSSRNRLESTGSIGLITTLNNGNKASSASTSLNIDVKID